MKSIVVVGSLNIDLVALAERIPVAGETLHGSHFQAHFGGKGANQAVAVARLGYPVSMIGKVGSDSFGKQLLTHLKSAGVDREAVETTDGVSGTALIVVNPQGENSIVIVPGANADVSPEYLEKHRAIIRNAGMVLTQLEIPVETVEHLAKICTKDQVPLILDPAPAKEIPPTVVRQVDWLTPNMTEAAFFTRRNVDEIHNGDAGEIVSLLLQQGAGGVILKMSSHGAYIATRHGIRQHIDAVPAVAVDTTGAGDAFNGAFAVARMLGRSPVESARFAAAAAALSITKAGAQSSMPKMKDVQRLLESVSANAGV